MIELFGFCDVIFKLGFNGGVFREGFILLILVDCCCDWRLVVRVVVMFLLGKFWVVGIGELFVGNEVVIVVFDGVLSCIYNVFYVNDVEVNVLLDCVIFECLIFLNYLLVKKIFKFVNGSL